MTVVDRPKRGAVSVEGAPDRRGKKSIVIDLKSAEGAAVALGLPWARRLALWQGWQSEGVPLFYLQLAFFVLLALFVLSFLPIAIALPSGSFFPVALPYTVVWGFAILISYERLGRKETTNERLGFVLINIALLCGALATYGLVP